MVPIKISQIRTKKQKLLSTLKDEFYSNFQAMKQILMTNTQGGSHVLKHGVHTQN